VDREPLEKLRYRYESVARELDPFELTRADAELRFEESDVLPDLGRRPRRLLLDYYSTHGLELALERYGLLKRLRGAGYADLRVSLVPDDPGAQVVRVEGVPVATGGEPVLLVELVLSRRVVPAPAPLGGASVRLPVLRIEWLLLQDPVRPFSATRPRLPGQEHPGLGLAHEVHQLLVQVCQRLHLEAIVYRPAHYHNAVVAAREYRFVDPEAEGRFRAMRRVLANVTLAVATHDVEERRVALADGTAVPWEPAELMSPVSDRVQGYFASKDYNESSQRACDRWLEAGLHVNSPRG
jgi:hypothetical protein